MLCLIFVMALKNVVFFRILALFHTHVVMFKCVCALGDGWFSTSLLIQSYQNYSYISSTVAIHAKNHSSFRNICTGFCVVCMISYCFLFHE